MGAMAYQITSQTIVYSNIYSGADERKYQKLRVAGLCAGNSPVVGKFPAQMASNAENVSIWRRHHVATQLQYRGRCPYMLPSAFNNANKIRHCLKIR